MAAIVGLALLLPIGGLLGAPVAMLGAFWLTAFLAFGLIALLYWSPKSCWSKRMKAEKRHRSPPRCSLPASCCCCC